MKKIKIVKWTEKVPDSEGNVQEHEGNTLSLLSYMLNSTDPQKMPRGFDQFRMFGRINKAFQKAEEEMKNQSPAFIELEDADYEFIRKSIENEIPAKFAMISEISEAVEEFMNPSEA